MAIFRVLWGLSLPALLVSQVVFAQQQYVQGPVRDFYTAPSSGEREELGNVPDESIDPLSGALTLSHTDLVLPVSGQLEFKVQRVYQSNNVYLNMPNTAGVAPTALRPPTPTGLGWTMHFGRVRYTVADWRNPCSITDGSERLSISDNPVLELPDGGQEILVVNRAPELALDNSQFTGTDARYMSRNHWIGDCLDGDSAFTVTSPQGVRYEMRFRVASGSDPTSSTVR